MRYFLILCITIFTIQAHPFPKAGDSVRYRISKSNSPIKNVGKFKILKIKNSKPKQIRITKKYTDGQKYRHWVKAKKVYDPNILNNCKASNGVLEIITVKAGTFNACKTRKFIKRKGKNMVKVEKWEGLVPFKLIKLRRRNLRSKKTTVKTLIKIDQV